MQKVLLVLLLALNSLFGGEQYSNVIEQIKKEFMRYYQKYQFHIQSIELKPIGKEMENVKILEIKLNEGMLKKNSFTLPVVAQVGKTKLTLAYLCQIKAELEVYSATEDIRSGEDFDAKNTQKQTIAFEGGGSVSVSEEELQSSSARSFIKQGQIITPQKIKPKIIVFKGEIVEVSMQIEGVSIQARMEAMQNGSLGEMIKVRNMESKKVIKALVVGRLKGVIQ